MRVYKSAEFIEMLVKKKGRLTEPFVVNEEIIVTQNDYSFDYSFDYCYLENIDFKGGIVFEGIQNLGAGIKPSWRGLCAVSEAMSSRNYK